MVANIFYCDVKYVGLNHPEIENNADKGIQLAKVNFFQDSGNFLF
jgi:hypothetical protein